MIAESYSKNLKPGDFFKEKWPNQIRNILVGEYFCFPGKETIYVMIKWLDINQFGTLHAWRYQAIVSGEKYRADQNRTIIKLTKI